MRRKGKFKMNEKENVNKELVSGRSHCSDYVQSYEGG